MAPSIATLAKATRVGLSAARTSELERRVRIERRGIHVAVCAALGRGDDAIDVGAHEGTLMRRIVECAPDGRHLAVEPLPIHAEALREAMPPSVIVEECAVTDDHRPTERDFLHVLGDDDAVRDRPVGTDDPAPRFQRLRVEGVSLDTLVQRHGLAPRLVHVDAEGAELEVLEGARRTIAEHRPWLIVGHGCAPTDYTDRSAAFFSLARELSLRIFDFHGQGPYDREHFLQAAGPFGACNFLLRP